MKNKFLSSLAVLLLVLSAGALTAINAQTTDETPAPSDQPSAPMEMGFLSRPRRRARLLRLRRSPVSRRKTCPKHNPADPPAKALPM